MGWKTWHLVEWNKVPPPVTLRVTEAGASRLDVALAFVANPSWLLEEGLQEGETGLGLRVILTHPNGEKHVLDESPLNMEKKLSVLYPPKDLQVRIQAYTTSPQHTIPQMSVVWRGVHVVEEPARQECSPQDVPLPCAQKDQAHVCLLGSFTWSPGCTETGPEKHDTTKVYSTRQPPKATNRRLLQRLRDKSQSTPEKAVTLPIPIIVVIVTLVLAGVGLSVWAVLEDERKLNYI